MLYGLLLAVALGLAVLAVLRVSQLSRRLQRLSQDYWELRYEHDQLKARIDGQGGRRPNADAATEAAPGPGPGARTGAGPEPAFVPLSSLRR